MDPVIEKTQTARPLSPQRPRRPWAYMLVATAVLLAADFALSAPNSFPKGDAVFTISAGDALVNVADALEAGQYVRSKIVLSTLVTLMGGEHRISPGDYQFRHDESALGIARQISTGDHNSKQIKVTVPEGKTADEISALLAQKLADFDQAAFKAAAAGHEGYLFPETYFFFPTATAEGVVQEMLAMFDSETAAAFKKYPLGGRTKADIVTMASLVEREAHGSDDRATIAGILYKRLALGMRLQVDATVAYAAGKGDGSLEKADFLLDSPYNTYRHGGLPPGPIANPGLEALKAALDPAETAYLYYLHDKNGSIHYAKTYAEHQKNIAKYLK